MIAAKIVEAVVIGTSVFVYYYLILSRPIREAWQCEGILRSVL